jgi:hypothetical protein
LQQVETWFKHHCIVKVRKAKEKDTSSRLPRLGSQSPSDLVSHSETSTAIKKPRALTARQLYVQENKQALLDDYRESFAPEVGKQSKIAEYNDFVNGRWGAENTEVQEQFRRQAAELATRTKLEKAELDTKVKRDRKE